MEAALNEALLLLSRGLDLCVRARKLDEALEAAAAAGGVGSERPMQGAGTRCLTPALWVQEAYDRDLIAWQNLVIDALSRLAPHVDYLPVPSATTALLALAASDTSDASQVPGRPTP